MASLPPPSAPLDSSQPQLPPPAQGRSRLEVELEFIQCLANPYYLTYLAHSKALSDERFVAYLDYLTYFRRPEYAKLLTYPTYSLGALTLLQQPQFRADVANPAVAQQILIDMVKRYVPSTAASTVKMEGEGGGDNGERVDGGERENGGEGEGGGQGQGEGEGEGKGQGEAEEQKPAPEKRNGNSVTAIAS